MQRGCTTALVLVGAPSAHVFTWNLASKLEVIEDCLALAGEVYGDSRAGPYYQAGVRWWLQPDLYRVDLTLVGPFGGAPQLTLGLDIYESVQRGRAGKLPGSSVN